MSKEIILPVSIFKEGKHYVAYTSALDLSTSAKTFDEVKKRLFESVQIFFEELAKKETTEEVLKGLGWHKTNGSWSPPVLISQGPEKFKVTI